MNSGSTSIGLAYARPFEAGATTARSLDISMRVISGGSVPVQLPSAT
jgi:hypothetical protein